MSDTSRKRSRKSKLVPRECTVEYEDSDDLQVAIEEPAIEDKAIKTAPPKKKQKENKQSKKGKKIVKLVRIAPVLSSSCDVEKNLDINIINRINQFPSMNGNSPQLGPSQVVPQDQILRLPQTDSQNKKSIDLSTLSINQPTASTEKPMSPIKFNIKVEVETCEDGEQLWNLSKTCYTLTSKEILYATDKILKNTIDIADTILSIDLKNSIGYFNRRKFKLKRHEKYMQKLFDMWRSWVKKTFYREAPVFYKCYVCQRSWWSLHEFQEHIKSHEELNITLELYEKHEVNVIAYNTRIKPHVTDIHTEGLCSICGKDFDAHILENRIGNKLFGNEGCPKTFYTCTGLKDHVTYCVECNPKQTDFQCVICKTYFDDDCELDVHLNTCHTVRSDIPIMSPYKTCKECNARYIYSCYCRVSEKKLYQCRVCLRTFPLKGALDLHLKFSKQKYKCEICYAIVPFACGKHEHMLIHSKNYVGVKKCVICKDFNVFLNYDAAEEHRLSTHGDEEEKYYFSDIIIPKPCLDMSSNEWDSEVDLENLMYESDSSSESDSGDSVDWLSDNESYSFLKSHKFVPSAEQRRIDLEAKNENQTSEETEVPFKNSIKLKNINDLVTIHNPDEIELNPDESVLNRTEISVKQEKIDMSENESQELTSKLDQAVTVLDNGIIIKYEKALVPKSDVNSDEFENSVTTLDSTKEGIQVKDEPRDVSDETTVTIKNEPIDEYEATEYTLNQPVTNDSTEPDKELYNIKDEPEFEIEEYEDDIIKLNIDLDEHLLFVKEEPQDSQDSVEFQQVIGDVQTDPQELMQDLVDEEHDNVIDKTKSRRFYKCNKCHFKGRHKEYRKHLDNDCKQTIYSCSKCKKDFISMKRFLAHFVLHGHKMLCCPICKVQHYNFSKLITHVNSHIKQGFVRFKSINIEGSSHSKEYQCKMCSELVQMSDFFVHWESHIPEVAAKASTSTLETMKACAIEAETDEAVINESIRLLKSTNNKVCNQCNRGFGRYNECKRHIIEHLLVHAYSKNMQELRCQICDDRFFTPEKYKGHMRQHAALPVYMCELCDKSFSDSSNFTKHKKVHNLTVLRCHLCSKKFQLRATLDKHMEKHRSSVPVVCPLCNKSFHFESTYHRHVRYYHDKNTIGFRCIACGARFTTLKEKWDHMWEVHKERKHKADCPICLKSFRKYSDVRAHAKKEHNIEVSLYSVKAQGQNTPTNVKNVIDFEELLKNSEFRLGEEETLVILE